MKKATALILALILVMSLSTSALAATITTGDQNIDVKGKYLDNTKTPTVYSVDVSWGAMQFTYTESGAMTWDPANHTYTDSTSGSWTANGNTVTVTNHSNAEVTATFVFEALDDYNDITGKFDVESEKLDAGVENGYDAADSVTAKLTLEGELAETVTDYTKIGTITVKIA